MSHRGRGRVVWEWDIRTVRARINHDEMFPKFGRWRRLVASRVAGPELAACRHLPADDLRAPRPAFGVSTALGCGRLQRRGSAGTTTPP